MVHSYCGKFWWLNIKMLELPYGPETQIHLHTQELETCVHIKPCTWIFHSRIGIGKKWEQPKYPSTESE